MQYEVRGSNQRGGRGRTTRRCSVEETARVSVPAGTFDSYRVVCEDRWRGREFFIAPEVGTTVLYTSTPKQRGHASRSEPVSWQPAEGCAVGVTWPGTDAASFVPGRSARTRARADPSLPRPGCRPRGWPRRAAAVTIRPPPRGAARERRPGAGRGAAIRALTVQQQAHPSFAATPATAPCEAAR